MVIPTRQERKKKNKNEKKKQKAYKYQPNEQDIIITFLIVKADDKWINQKAILYKIMSDQRLCFIFLTEQIETKITIEKKSKTKSYKKTLLQKRTAKF